MINLKDKLSHLTYMQACKLLGTNGEKLIRQGGKYEIDLSEHVVLSRDLFELNLGEAVVTISLDTAKNQKLNFRCSTCTTTCEHIGAAFSLILEEKMALGLAAPPPERIPIESLTDAELVEQAVSERAERAKNQKMSLKSLDSSKLWTDYTVMNYSSGKTYRVALRGWERGESYCTCPDFRKNTLGTCKHILHILDKMKNRFNKTVRETPYQINSISVYMRYGEELELRMLIPENLDRQAMTLIHPFKNKPVKDAGSLIECIRTLQNDGYEVTVYPDAQEYIQCH